MAGYSYATIWLEFRLPPGVPAPDRAEAELRTDKQQNHMRVSFNDSVPIGGREGNHVVLRGYVDTWSRTPNRTIALRVGDGPTHLFKLKLPASPPNSEPDAWYPTDLVEQAGNAPQPPAPGDNIDIRYGVGLKP